jgi:BirA family transcriptional regulator, biotin operon repressor / biotin---[acetyl-CoA-carboxylase] ligase
MIATATELLSLEDIRRRLRGTAVGTQIYLYGEVDSTNAKLRALARAEAAEGTVVLAEGQTAGRGRQGAAWFSPSGVNLYVSVLFRPAISPRELGVFTFVASLALADAVKDQGVVPAIKWPNDVLVGGRKIGGALVESALHGQAVEHVIVGVGANLNVEVEALVAALGPAGRFATSLAAECGHEIDRNAFAAAYLNHLERWVDVWTTDGPSEVVAAWRARDILTGRRVEVRGPDRPYEGRVLGVDETGALLVLDTIGARRSVTAADVRILD